MTLADDYEQWFGAGDRSLLDFLATGQYSHADIEELVLTDQFLRHQAGVEISPQAYAEHIPEVAADRSLQITLYLEAFGYAEERGETSERYLGQVPESLRGAVAAQILADPLHDESDTRNTTAPRLARYRIEDELGRGSFGVVYRAWDDQLEREVAVKVGYYANQEQGEIAEAKLVAGLQHPGILPVYDCGTDDQGRSYFVTGVIKGADLADWASTDPPPNTTEICRLFIKLCDALHAAHQHGIVHRDLKPSNLIVRPTGDPVLLDFGLALRNWQAGRQGELVGTPAYMSPEQARGEGHLVDARSDVFSTGVLLFETLAGKRPWKCESSRELIREIAHGSVRSIREIKATLPIELERICSKATAGMMANRYGSAELLAADLRWFIEQSPASTPLPSRTGLQARGIRPYTAEDAEGFWELLPGQRDAKGRPDPVVWWIEQLNERESPRGVLVLYGPSGSGKSSLLHAGVLPHIDRTLIRSMSVDASEDRTPQRIARRIAEQANFGARQDHTLAELLAEIRQRSGKRIVVVIDQFEQMLAEATDDDHELISRALRQADGKKLQFILVVRDEFWSLTSRLMRALDSPLRDGITAMGLERFTPRHAVSVLRTWSRNHAANEHPVSERFLQSAVSLVSENDQVIPVRLALLATMLGDDAWTELSLHRIAEQRSLGALYLDSVLGQRSLAQRRGWQQPASRILAELTPASGAIRGPSVSEQALCIASGLQERSDEFGDLIDYLDRQVNLVTPTMSSHPRPSQPARESSSAARHFQLTHDFLVAEVRQWLEMSERGTVSGRATADWRFAASRWVSDQRHANLAGPIECVRFATFGKNHSDTTSVEFLRHSARLHLRNFLFLSLAALVVAASGWYVVQRTIARGLVARLADASPTQLPAIINEAHERSAWVTPLLRVQMASEGPSRDRAMLVLLRQDPSLAMSVVNDLTNLNPDLFPVVLDRLKRDLPAVEFQQVVATMAEHASAPELPQTARLRYSIGLAALSPQHPSTEALGQPIAEMLMEADLTKLGWLVEGLAPIRDQLKPHLTELYNDALDPQRKRTASYVLAEYASGDPESLVELLFGASRDQLPAISPAIRNASASVAPILRQRWGQTLAGLENDELLDSDETTASRDGRRHSQELRTMQDRVARARGLGNWGALLMQLGETSLVLPQLTASHDPTLRNYLIENYAASGGEAGPIASLLDKKLDAGQHSIASALIQILGSLPASSFVPPHLEQRLKKVLFNSTSTELHAVTEWYFRRRGRIGVFTELLSEPRNNQSWYVTSQSHTMLRLPGPTNFIAGSSPNDADRQENERRHRVEIPDHLYFSSHEVTIEQFQRFLSDRYGQSAASEPTAAPQDPMLRVGWYEAAEYCNWLSEIEGIDDSQFVYLPNERGEYAPGMRVADDYLGRSGYQLPTPDFWEYACRAGTTTPRPYGLGIDLAAHFMRTVETPKLAERSVGLLKPNAFGLFDMLGGASEWTVGLVIPPQRPPGRFQSGPLVPTGGPESVNPAGMNITNRRRLLHLGGSVTSQSKVTRSAARSKVAPPNNTTQPIGIRLMRILPSD